MDSDLFNQYLNIKQEPADDTAVVQPLTGGNIKPETDQAVSDSQEPADDTAVTQPLTGGNAGPETVQALPGSHDPAPTDNSELNVTDSVLPATSELS